MSDKVLTILEDESSMTEEENTLNATETSDEQQNGLSESVENLKKENLELSEQVKRTAAEFKNFQRRQEEEQKRVKLRLREDVLRSMLPILDHLERTLAAVKDGGEGAFTALTQGVELIDKDVRRIFNEHGLSEIKALGEHFDPALHEAVMMEENEAYPDQTIIAQLQKGYKLEDRVIRPSMVKVARNYST